jgi:short-subunit dehydrogenase
LRVEAKVIAVTGAGSGIGRQVAIELARRNAILALCGRRREPLKETARLVENAGSVASVHSVDVSDRDQVGRWASAVVADHDRVDGLITGAGIGLAGQGLDAADYRHFRRIVDVNLWGTVHAALAFLPYLRVRPVASLVAVASSGALLAFPDQVAYCTSKFAVRGFIEGLRMELAGMPVHVMLVLPGVVRGTEVFLRSLGTSQADAQEVHARMQKIPFSTPVDRCARKIVNGIERERTRVLVGKDGVVVDCISRAMPGLFLRMGSLASKVGDLSKVAVQEALTEGGGCASKAN